MIHPFRCKRGEAYGRALQLLSKYVGDSERAVRNLFSKARALAPCILFFDEIDALGSARGYGGGDGNGGASEGILTSMLTEMDGVQQLGVGVTIVGATNRPEVLVRILCFRSYLMEFLMGWYGRIWL